MKCPPKQPITVGLCAEGAVQQESAATSSIYNGSYRPFMWRLSCANDLQRPVCT